MSNQILRKIADSLTASIESYPIHHAVATYADARAGKPITKKDITVLEEAHPGWRFTLHKNKYAWDTSKELSFWKDGAWDGTRSELRLTRESGGRWPDSETLKKDTNNARYFEYADARNAERSAALNPDETKLAGLVQATTLAEQIALLINELKGTVAAYELSWETCSVLSKVIEEKTGEKLSF